ARKVGVGLVVDRLGADRAAEAQLAVERLAGDDVDRCADAARGDRSARGLVDHELADTFRGDVGEVERTGRAGDEIAVLVLPDRGDARGRHRAAVEGDEVVARTETTDSHARAFTVDAIDRHAGDALERFREVGVGELADVFGGNAVDDTRRIALEVD